MYDVTMTSFLCFHQPPPRLQLTALRPCQYLEVCNTHGTDERLAGQKIVNNFAILPKESVHR